MDHSTSYEEDSGIYVVRVSGDYHRGPDSDQNKQLVSRMFQAHGYRRFLFDMRGARIHSRVLSTYQAASVGPDLSGQLHQVCTAMVLDHLSEDDQFFENVAMNRGFDLRVFTDLQRARAWLLAS